MITFVVFSVRRALSGFWRNLVMSVAATATMVLMLLLLAGFWIVQAGLLAGLEFVEQKVEIVADLQDETTPDEIAALLVRVRAMPEVAAVSYISRDEALVRFREARAAEGEEDLTRYLETNPLRASIEVGLVDTRDFGIVSERLRGEAAVERVKNIKDLVDRVLTVTEFLRTGGTVVLLIIGFIVLFIIVNTIRLAVVVRADEIEVMRLVGASDAFIRWPFVFEGAFVGLLGASIALGVLGIAAEPLNRFMFEFFRVLPINVAPLTRDLVLLIGGAGVGLGVLGSWISVRTYLIR